MAAQSKAPAKPAPKNPVASSPASIAAGEATFKRNCRFCHGEDAKGNGPQAPKDTHPPDLTDAKWDHGSTDGDIFNTIKDGYGAEGPEIKVSGAPAVAETSKHTSYLLSLEVRYLQLPSLLPPFT